jgi:hypothetical protein
MVRTWNRNQRKEPKEYIELRENLGKSIYAFIKKNFKKLLVVTHLPL